MTPMHAAINALAHVTVWLAVIIPAIWLVRRSRQAVQWRALLLRVGLAGVPVVLLIGSLEHRMPWARPLWRVPPAASQDGPADAATAGRAGTVSGEHQVAAAPAGARLPWSPAGVGAHSNVTRPRAAIGPIIRQAAVAAAWPTLVALWLSGVSLALTRIAIGLVRLRARRRTWQPITDEKIRQTAARLAGRVGLRRPFRLLACDDLPMPVATGSWRPAVVLPREQFSYLASPEGRAVLAHELAHLRYRDPLWRLLGAAVGALLWFHPLVRWMNRRIEIEAEFLCDQSALEAGADRRDYARLLVGLAERAWADRPLAAAAIGAVHRTSHLERRLTMILARTSERFAAMPGRTRWAVLALSVLLAVSLTSVPLVGEQGPAEPSPPVGAAAVAEPVPAEPIDPADAVATARGARADDRAIITLVDGQQIEGLWLGASLESLTLRLRGGDQQIALDRVADIHLIRPSERARLAGEDRARKPGDAQRNAIRRWIAEAEGLAKVGQRDAAIARLEMARQAAPNNAAILRALARLCREAGKTDLAESAEKALKNLDAASRLPSGLAAEYARLRQAVGSAEARLADARRLPVTDASRPAAIEQAEGSLREAREAADQFRRRNFRSPPPADKTVRDGLRRADDLMSSGRWDEALSLLTDLHRSAPRNQMVLRSLVRTCERLGQNDKAESFRTLLRELDPPPPASGV